VVCCDCQDSRTKIDYWPISTISPLNSAAFARSE
jgi:hypothetical protein